MPNVLKTNWYIEQIIIFSYIMIFYQNMSFSLSLPFLADPIKIPPRRARNAVAPETAKST